jgi:esterase
MKLFYRKSGNGRPLIILHGLFGISDNWAALARQWAERFTVYAVDLRNHGQSPHSDEWNYNVMADDIIELLGDERLHDVILLGHSMGGKTAMRLALDFPQAISKLIVSDIAPRQTPENNRYVVDALLKVHPEKCTSRKEAEEILRKENLDNGTIQFLLKNLFWKEYEDGTKHLDWRFNLPVISKNLTIVSEATNSPAPCNLETLFVRGSRSNYINAEDEKEIAAVFPHSKIVTIEDAGHWVHADKPKEMFEVVMDFCNA